MSFFFFKQQINMLEAKKADDAASSSTGYKKSREIVLKDRLYITSSAVGRKGKGQNCCMKSVGLQ